MRVHRFLVFATLIAVLFAGLCLAADEPATKTFRQGETKEYMAITPKDGFAGGMRTAQVPPAEPRGADCFDTQFIRVTVVAEARDLPDAAGTRAVLRVDKVEKDGKMLQKGIFFVTVDKTPAGCQIAGVERDDPAALDVTTAARENVPFPFAFSRPPAFGPGEEGHDGYVNEMSGRGTEYVRKHGKVKEEKLGEGSDAVTSDTVVVEATHFEMKEAGDWMNAAALPVWHGPDTEDAVKAGKATVLSKETQKWSKAGDWLWDEMERYDASGHLMIGLTKVTLPKVADEPKPDNGDTAAAVASTR